MDQAQQADRTAIDALIQYERSVRDAGMWAEMAACYHPDSYVEVSWFQGSGAEFAERSSRIAGGSVHTFHQMSPAVVTVRGDRAVAETGCNVHGLTVLNGVGVDISSYSRLLWRALRTGSGWLLAGMRAYYISDAIIPVDPSRVPRIDGEAFDALRQSYRCIAYSMKASGFPVRDDLAGVDRPETVAAMRAGEEAWLAEG